MSEFRMPLLGADMEAGTLVEWLKKTGDPVVRGDIIAVVDTEKGAIEIEVFEDGVVERTLVEPGAKVPVGTTLALIRRADEAPSVASAVPPPSHEGRASPAARKAAQGLQVDLAGVDGTGPGGAITRDDVERAASRRRVGAGPGLSRATSPATGPVASSTPAPAARTAAMRSAIAAAMSRSKREIPHVYLSTTVDMTRALAWLASENGQRSVDQRVLPIALLVKAAARAVRDVPEVNGFWVDGAFRPGPGVHVGCAIALRDGGLVAPAIHDLDRLDLTIVMRELTDLVARARGGTLRSSELSDPTITVTNLGDLGVEAAFAIIYPPQVAIAAFGKVVQRPWVVDSQVEVRSVMSVSVSADHRAVDGRRAGQFLAAIDRWLQIPEQL